MNTQNPLTVVRAETVEEIIVEPVPTRAGKLHRAWNLPIFARVPKTGF
jgi:hypothetical protein